MRSDDTQCQWLVHCILLCSYSWNRSRIDTKMFDVPWTQARVMQAGKGTAWSNDKYVGFNVTHQESTAKTHSTQLYFLPWIYVVMIADMCTTKVTQSLCWNIPFVMKSLDAGIIWRLAVSPKTSGIILSSPIRVDKNDIKTPRFIINLTNFPVKTKESNS